ncbi:winged helix-turn-helix domain-containing protein [Streptomyces sp. NBC_01716]|uniref:winged helix-turn-helix domain-containing protein n=1 Tax=Streptomyces sp. NBC_01716 TaxID=2975917 RepID=UPI002E36F440|nr:winged helix-turn-helix domain-containing protein [Streptomyces sp. NBC_01716]
MVHRESGHDEPRYWYATIADGLRAAINRGDFRATGRLPTNEELAERFGASRSTVLKALDVLREERLIVSRRGSGTFVAPGLPGGVVPSEAEGAAVASESVPAVMLGPSLDEAFRASAVTLDVYSMTTEVLANRISDQAQRIREDRNSAPASIRARLMLPDTRAPLPVPRNIDDPEDPRPLQRLQGILYRSVSQIRQTLFDLQAKNFVPEVMVDVRVVPSVPGFKLYILNGNQALQGLYEITEHHVMWEKTGEVMTIRDAIGLGSASLLHPYRADADSLPGSGAVFASSRMAFVVRAQKFFDSYWEHLAVEADF